MTTQSLVWLPASQLNSTQQQQYNCGDNACSGHGSCAVLFDLSATDNNGFNLSEAHPFNNAIDDTDVVVPAAFCICDHNFQSNSDFLHADNIFDGQNACVSYQPATIYGVFILMWSGIFIFSMSKIISWFRWHSASRIMVYEKAALKGTKQVAQGQSTLTFNDTTTLVGAQPLHQPAPVNGQRQSMKSVNSGFRKTLSNPRSWLRKMQSISFLLPLAVAVSSILGLSMGLAVVVGQLYLGTSWAAATLHFCYDVSSNLSILCAIFYTIQLSKRVSEPTIAAGSSAMIVNPEHIMRRVKGFCLLGMACSTAMCSSVFALDGHNDQRLQLYIGLTNFSPILMFAVNIVFLLRTFDPLSKNLDTVSEQQRSERLRVIDVLKWNLALTIGSAIIMVTFTGSLLLSSELRRHTAELQTVFWFFTCLPVLHRLSSTKSPRRKHLAKKAVVAPAGANMAAAPAADAAVATEISTSEQNEASLMTSPSLAGSIRVLQVVSKLNSKNRSRDSSTSQPQFNDDSQIIGGSLSTTNSPNPKRYRNRVASMQIVHATSFHGETSMH